MAVAYIEASHHCSYVNRDNAGAISANVCLCC